MNMHALTGPWLMVKWVGVSIAAAYLVLLLTVLIRFRRDLTRLRGWLIWPVVLGVFISSTVPYIFMDVTVARVCFVAASVVYVGGIGVLVRGLAQKNHRVLLKADG